MSSKLYAEAKKREGAIANFLKDVASIPSLSSQEGDVVKFMAAAMKKMGYDEVVIDGVLDEPVWHEAARLTGFSRYAPVDGGAADRTTEVLVWYSPTAIHFGVRATAGAGGLASSSWQYSGRSSMRTKVAVTPAGNCRASASANWRL